MKKKNIILIAIVALILLFSGLAVYRGTTQQAIGDFQSSAACEAYAAKNFCANGYYACSPCTSKNLGYTLQFSDGTKTNIVWGSDCVAKGTSAANDGNHGFCSQATSITSHVGYWCDGGNDYWFNSAGQREDLRATCSNGCTSNSKGGTTKVDCNVATSNLAAPTGAGLAGSQQCWAGGTQASVGATTSYLCKSLVGGNYPYGCSGSDLYKCPTTCDWKTNSCAQATCTDECKVGTLRQDGTGFDRCIILSSTPCTTWNNGLSCPTGQTFVNGACQLSKTTTIDSNDVSIHQNSVCNGKVLCMDTSINNNQLFCGATITCAYGCGAGNTANSAGCLPPPAQTPTGGIDLTTHQNAVCKNGNVCANSVMMNGAPLCGTTITCNNGCAAGDAPNSAQCLPPATLGTPTPAKTCTSLVSCDGNSIKTTKADCTTSEVACDAGKECQIAFCVTKTITPKTIPVAAPVASLCDGVTCGDYCDADYAYHSSGTCDATTGQCQFAKVESNSAQCLPTAPNNATGSITGDVVAAPTPASNQPTWFDKYGYYVGGALIVALIVIYLMIETKGKKKKR